MTQSQVTITSSERETAIVRTSAIGIAANVALAAFKAAVVNVIKPPLMYVWYRFCESLCATITLVIAIETPEGFYD